MSAGKIILEKQEELNKTIKWISHWCHKYIEYLPKDIIILCKNFSDEPKYDYDMDNIELLFKKIEPLGLNFIKSEEGQKIYGESSDKITPTTYWIRCEGMRIFLKILKEDINTKNPTFSEKVLIKYKNVFLNEKVFEHLNTYAEGRKYSENTLNIFVSIGKMFNWNMLATFCYVDEKIYNNYLKKYGNSVIDIDIDTNIYLDVNFMLKYHHMLDWQMISWYRDFTEKEISILEKYINWDKFSYRKNLKRSIINKYYKKIDFVSYIKYNDKLYFNDFIKIFSNNKKSIKLITECVGKKFITKKILEKAVNINTFIVNFASYLDLYIISREDGLRLDVNTYIAIEYLLTKKQWENISLYHNISEEVLCRFRSNINISSLILNDHFDDYNLCELITQMT